MEQPRPIRIAKAVSRAKKLTFAKTDAAAVGLQALLIALGPVSVVGQNLPAPEDRRHSMLREAMLGILTDQASIPEIAIRQHCLPLPSGAPDDRLQSPHGDSIINTNCEVVPDQPIDGQLPTGWITSRYRWTSVFTAEDKGRGPDAQDKVTEEEVVLFEASAPDQVRAVWHARFDTGPYAIWASVTPEVAQTSDGKTLLSVMSCLNGTGGCGQEFIQRRADGHWYPVRQDWLDQLPKGFLGRIRHGVRIDPRTLHGEAGFYGDRDPNCCPSQRLVAQLKLRGDSLVLVRHTLVVER
jgi:hypothetical protein